MYASADVYDLYISVGLVVIKLCLSVYSGPFISALSVQIYANFCEVSFYWLQNAIYRNTTDVMYICNLRTVILKR